MIYCAAEGAIILIKSTRRGNVGVNFSGVVKCNVKCVKNITKSIHVNNRIYLFNVNKRTIFLCGM